MLGCGAAAILWHRGRPSLPLPRHTVNLHTYHSGNAAVVWADGESEVETRLRGKAAPAIPFPKRLVRNSRREAGGLPVMRVNILAAPDTPFTPRAR